MTKRSIFVILTFILMPFVTPIIAVLICTFFNMTDGSACFGTGQFISYLLGLIVILLLVGLKSLRRGLDGKKTSIGATVIWCLVGTIFVFAAQSCAIFIESLLGIGAGSNNTKEIVSFAMKFPLVIITTSLFVPVIEEIVFRKVIFRDLYAKTNFFVAALVSSLLFALIHFEFEHLILYTVTGLCFSFLYVKTNRIIVPIVSHVSLNSFIMIFRIFIE